MTKRWRIEAEHEYEAFKIFRIFKSRRINPRTGKPFDFFLMEGLDWVNVIALTPNREVVLVEQLRHGINQHTIEIPGGCVEPGEQPIAAARRELLEETGFEAKTLRQIGEVQANPAMQSMRCTTFLATDAVRSAAPQLDPGEDITVRVEPLAAVLRMVREGVIAHALVVSAFAHLLLEEQFPERAAIPKPAPAPEKG